LLVISFKILRLDPNGPQLLTCHTLPMYIPFHSRHISFATLLENSLAQVESCLQNSSQNKHQEKY
jgi:hypothetical protein